jgi:hypothetical protein
VQCTARRLKLKYDFMRVFEDNHERIYEDYLSVKNATQPWPEYHLYDRGWDVFGLFINAYWMKSAGIPNPVSSKAEGGVQVLTQECSFTRNLITEHVSGYGTCGFSILRAGAVIKPHEGVKSNYLRMHLGLEIPEGDMGLNSDTHGSLKWEKGKAIYFDDRRMHEAWNKTDKDRVILIVDFEEVK